nr:hypothetical protein [uncultured Carboxylicivirga sp.]
MKKLIAIMSFLAIYVVGNAQNGTVHQMYKLPEESKTSSGEGKGIELTPLYGYQFNGRIDGYKDRFKMYDAANYGLALSMEVKPQVRAELSYSISPTDAAYSSIYGDHDRYNIDIHYFQLGGIYELTDTQVKPFGLFSLGATWFDFKSGASDHVSFSAAMGAGLKIFLSDRIGIRLQGRLLLPMYFEGGGLFLGIGTGGSSSGFGISTGVLAVQGELSGGLIFRF